MLTWTCIYQCYQPNNANTLLLHQMVEKVFFDVSTQRSTSFVQILTLWLQTTSEVVSIILITCSVKQTRPGYMCGFITSVWTKILSSWCQETLNVQTSVTLSSLLWPRCNLVLPQIIYCWKHNHTSSSQICYERRLLWWKTIYIYTYTSQYMWTFVFQSHRTEIWMLSFFISE